MVFETNKDKGRAGLAVAIAYYGANGYTVNIPINDTQWYDLIIEKEGQCYFIQCRATGSADNTIDLRSTGGTKGSTYDNTLNHPIDYVFCLRADGTIYNIPMKDIKSSNVIKSFKLIKSNEKSPSGKYKIDTSQYIVNI